MKAETTNYIKLKSVSGSSYLNAALIYVILIVRLFITIKKSSGNNLTDSVKGITKIKGL